MPDMSVIKDYIWLFILVIAIFMFIVAIIKLDSKKHGFGA